MKIITHNSILLISLFEIFSRVVINRFFLINYKNFYITSLLVFYFLTPTFTFGTLRVPLPYFFLARLAKVNALLPFLHPFSKI